MTLAEQIFAAKDLDRKAVEVKEWGTTVYVQQFNGHGRARVEKAFAENKADSVRRVCAVVAVGVVDENGKRVFTDEQIDALMEKNFDVLMRLYKRVLNHNDADAESMKSAEGNSGATTTDSSS